MPHEHPEKISDWREALCLLCSRDNDRAERTLVMTWPDRPKIVTAADNDGSEIASDGIQFPTTAKAVHELDRRWFLTAVSDKSASSRRTVRPKPAEPLLFRVSSRGESAYWSSVHDELLKEALHKMTDTGFDHLCEIQVRDRVCHILTSDPCNGRVRILYAIEEDMLTMGLMRILESRLRPDGWCALRCEVTEEGHHFLRRP